VETLLVDGDHALEPTLPQVKPAADGVAITNGVHAVASSRPRM
jgi:hypothetical protein